METLFEFALTPRLEGTEQLYFHRSANRVSFDTYFNSIPIRKIRQYTSIRELQFSHRADICTEHGHLKFGESIRLDEIPQDAELLFVQTPNMPVSLSVSAAGKRRQVQIAVIICTYRREKQVRAAVDYLLKHIERLPCHILLVDNASEIPPDTWDPAFVTLLHNCNNGGSGGFSRGMQYAAAQGTYTHLLLMDDDVILDAVTLQRLCGLLSYLKDEASDLCIAGSMLYADEPTVQFESGGYFSTDGMQTGYGYRFEMTDMKNILENEGDKPVNYSGWWFFCMPVRYAAEGQLPAPFFLKYDDVEYALRCRLQIITVNGIGVWHENFAAKYNAVQAYFDARNYLFLRKWHTPGFDETAACKKARYLLLEKLCRQQYQMAEAVCIAYEDYLKGEGNLTQICYEEKLAELRRLNYSMLNDAQLLSEYGIRFDPALYRTCSSRPFRRYMQPLLYGHLLPGWLCRKLTITDTLADRKEHYFGAGTVLHYDPSGHTGYVTKKNMTCWIHFLFRLITARWRLK